MKKTGVVYSPEYSAHDPGFGHPESPRRLKVIVDMMRRNAFFENESFALIDPRYATIVELELIHRPSYINLIREICESGGGVLDEHMAVSRESFDVARLASGGVVQAVDSVMSGELRNAFALIRPPGHHAGASYSLGFCIFNNVALAAVHLLREHDLDRILVLDIDAHHGNGTQEIFYASSRVLYVSLHEDPTEFPGTGFTDETGIAEGTGYNVNVPFPVGTGDHAYWKAIETIVIPISTQYKPQFILVSAGFDGYYMDGIGELSLSAHMYPKIFGAVLGLARQLCEDRVIAVLEGGYRLSFLKKIVPSVIGEMAGLRSRIRDRLPLLEPGVQRGADRIVEKVRRVQSAFWAL